MEQIMYQVSTLQALAMGYTRGVVSVDDSLKDASQEEIKEVEQGMLR